MNEIDTDRLNSVQRATWEAHLIRRQCLFAAIERLIFGAPGSRQEQRWDEFLGQSPQDGGQT